MSEYVDVAALGWEHGTWQRELYPDDMPQEWRLTYYANEFSSVVVPAARWQAATAEEITEWHESVSDTFRFYWELPSNETTLIERWHALTAPYHDQSGGVVIGCLPQASQEQAISQLNGVFPSVPLPAGIEPATGATLLGSLAIARCPEHPRRIRDLMEWMSASSCEGALMLCDNLPLLRQANLVAQMLGVSRWR